MRQKPAQQAAAPRRRFEEQVGGRPLSTKRAGDVSGRPVKGSLVIRIGLMVVVLFIIWLVAVRPRAGQLPNSPGAATPVAAPPTGQTTPAPTPSPPATATAGRPTTASPEQVAAQFLAAYFSWSISDTDQAYVQRWSQLVVPEMLAYLDGASPRQSLDNGSDSAAQSKTPPVSPGAVTTQQQSAQVTVTWTIHVLPQGGELATWQSRTIQATLSLTQTSAAWLIHTTTWSDSGS